MYPSSKQKGDYQMNIISLVQDEISAGELTWAQIAEKFNIPVWDVEMIFEDMMDQMAEDYNESMDGDFDSAMASAGYGTDEDYGYYGNEEF
jgi:hypothetical protein